MMWEECFLFLIICIGFIDFKLLIQKVENEMEECFLAELRFEGLRRLIVKPWDGENTTI